MPNPSPRLWLVLLTNWPSIWGLHTPFLRFNNLLEWLTELREVLYSLLPVYYEAYNSGTAKGKKCIGQGMWEMVWHFHDSSRCAPLPAHQCVHQLEALQTPSFVFHGNTWPQPHHFIFPPTVHGDSNFSTYSPLVVVRMWRNPPFFFFW